MGLSLTAGAPLSLLLVAALGFEPATAQTRGAEWAQDGGDAQRTGFTPEEPVQPWRFAWAWNGPDAQGGSGAHRYHQPQPHEPWEARICTGGQHVFVPAGRLGFYALAKTDGHLVWQFQSGTCHAAAAYDASHGTVVLGTEEGEVVQLDAMTGEVRGRFDAGAPVTKAMLLADEHVFALTRTGVLHKVALDSMKAAWSFDAQAAAQTSPAFSAAHRAVVFGTADLRVQCVSAEDGKLRWAVKPTPRAPGNGVEFSGGWPVIAERHGIVFVRLGLADIDTVLWSGGGPKGKWPGSNAAIRERLQARPELQTLFALRLEDGSPAFVPAVGPSGVEDLREGKPRLRPHSFPVIKPIDQGEVAYLHWRHGDTRDPKWDARWDSHLGEMTLDDAADLKAGDVRFVQFEEHNGWARITDESCPLSMAGNTLFYAHWNVSQSARILDRSPGLGLARTTPITTEPHPPVARHIRLPAARIDAATHWIEGSIAQMDGRTLRGPGWWVYANELDPPTPARDAYSEGILPRYTCVADGLVIVQGNGGDLFVLRHSGR